LGRVLKDKDMFVLEARLIRFLLKVRHSYRHNSIKIVVCEVIVHKNIYCNRGVIK
jgi:hypothetical protein